MYDQGMQNGSRRRGKSVLGSRVEKKTYSVDPNSSTSSQGLFPQKMGGAGKGPFPAPPSF